MPRCYLRVLRPNAQREPDVLITPHEIDIYKELALEDSTVKDALIVMEDGMGRYSWSKCRALAGLKQSL